MAKKREKKGRRHSRHAPVLVVLLLIILVGAAGNNISRETCAGNDEKRKAKTPSGITVLLQQRDSITFKWKEKYGERDRKSLPGCRGGRIYERLYTG